MTKLLYIPTGEYIKWWSEGGHKIPTIIYEESNWYKSDAHYGKMPIEVYLDNFIHPYWRLQDGHKKYNKLSTTNEYFLSEFEIIYD